MVSVTDLPYYVRAQYLLIQSMKERIFVFAMDSKFARKLTCLVILSFSYIDFYDIVALNFSYRLTILV